MHWKLLIYLCFTTVSTQEERLTAIYLPTKLPHGIHSHTAIYHEDLDSIFLLGGINQGGSVLQEILQYNLSTGSMESVGNLTFASFGGSAQLDRASGHVFYFGGGFVERFDPGVNSVGVVASLPHYITYGDSLGAPQVLLLGGWGAEGKGILTFHMGNLTTNYEGTLQFRYDTLTAVLGLNEAFIFGSGNPLIKLNLETFQQELIPSEELSRLTDYPSSVADGRANAYVIGGDSRSEGGIHKFNMENYETGWIPVDNFPTSGNFRFYNAPPAVFVEREGSSRIYLFGGASSNGTFLHLHDEIWYLDLINKTKS